MTGFLPWWITAIGLASVTLGFYLFSQKTLGVSGSWTRVIQWRDDKDISDAEAPFANQPELFKDALMKATIDHFGDQRVTSFMQARHQNKSLEPEKVSSKPVMRNHWSVHMVFLFALIIGGFVGAYLKGGASIQTDMGVLHSSLFGSGFALFMTLFIGGVMVGFGTQLGGGCTSGHGLSGVSRLVPASLIATMSFFGAAIIFSLAIHYLT
jgi:hypothetical protein